MHPQTYIDYVRKSFADDADHIIEVAERVISQGRIEITPQDLNISVKPNVAQSVEKVTNRSFVSENPEINYNGDPGAFNRMKKKFIDSIIKASIFNLDTGQNINPLAEDLEFETVLNKNMFNFKMSLLDTISTYTGISIDKTNTRPAAIFENIQTVLASFNAINSNISDRERNNPRYIDALDAYTMLSNFDSFLKEFSTFVKVRPGFEEFEAKNRYEYVGPTTNLNIVSYKDDDYKANKIETNTSDLISALLDYFPEYDEHGPIINTSISQVGFSQIAAAFKQWVDTVPFEVLVPEGRTEEQRKKDAFELLNNFYKGDENTINKLFKLFYERVFNFSDDIARDTFSKNKLRGIKQVFDSKLSNSIKRMLWGLAFKTEANVAKSTTYYDGSISNKRLQDNYKSKQWQNISDAIQNSVNKFRNKAPELFEQLRKKWGIEFDKNDPNIVHIFTINDFSVTLELQGGKAKYFTSKIQVGNETVNTGNKVPDEVAKKFIEDITGIPIPEDFQRVLNQVSDGSDNTSNLFNMYGDAIGIVLLSSYKDNNVDWINNLGDPKRESVNLNPFSSKLDSLKTFLGIAFGTNVSSTLRNQSGNNIAAYQLTSMIRQVPKLVLKMHEIKTEKNSFLSNPVYNSILNHKNHVKRPVTRIDANIKGKKKSSRDLTEAEVAYIGIMSDFFNSYMGDMDIEFQDTTFSDKNTHFSIPYSRFLKIDSKLELGTAIKNVLSSKNKKNREEQALIFQNAIFNSRKGTYEKILDNLTEDFSKGLVGLDNNPFKDVNINTLSAREKLDKIKQAISEIGSKGIEQSFKTNHVTFVPELHVSNGEFNDLLEYNINMYVINENDSLFNKRMEKQKRLFLNDLLEYGFSINRNVDPKNVNLLINEIGSDWEDTTTNEVALYKGNINDDFELNPMLEAYFYSDTLLSNSYNDILFGRTFFHPNKYKANKILEVNPITGIKRKVSTSDVQPGYIYEHDTDVVDDDFEYDPNTNKILLDESGKPIKSDNYYMHSEASRLSASYKRTVAAGATVHSMHPMKYGIDPNINFAVVKDLPGEVFNMLGIDTTIDSMDGSGFSSPIQAILENMSLQDAAVGMDKKTIFGDTEARYGMPTLLKWAVFALTNDRRQMSMGSKISADNLFKKMHNIPLGKTVDISKYYKSSKEHGYRIFGDINERKTLTRTKDIFRFDPYTGKYFLISNLEQSGNNLIYKEIEVDRYGNEIDGGIVNTLSKEINTIYDIDQVFGGAYCMEFDNKTKQLEYGNANNTLLADIVCYEELKDKMVSYVVNKSAIKVGARNINSGETLFSNNSDPFNTTSMSIQFGGVQMNADHELDEADVTEMSQMISALIQNGYFTDEVTQIYSEIGQIVTSSLRTDLNKLSENKKQEIHQKLGKDLIKMFTSGSKDTIGLAQSYLLKASKELENGNVEVNIPFSDPTLFGAFAANLISNINKSGIRRRYAGIAAVLVPSRGMIQYYQMGDKTYMFNDLCKYLRDHGYNKPAEYYINNMGEFDGNRFIIEANADGTYEENPFINEISHREADMGDTIILIDKNNNVVGKPIELNTWENFDKVRNLSNEYRCFKWSIKPRDLRQGDTTFIVNGKKYSMYDLDSVRGLHYLNQLRGKKEFIDLDLIDNDIKLSVIENALKIKLPRTGRISNSEIERYKSLLKRQLKLDLKALEDKTDLGHNTVFGKAPQLWLFNLKTEGESLNDKIKEEDPNITNITDFNQIQYLLNNNIDFYNTDKYIDLQNTTKLALLYNESRDLDTTILNAISLGIDSVSLALTLKLVNSSLNQEEVFSRYNELLSSFKNEPIIATDVNTRFAEIIMGRLNAEQLGLRKNDSISEVEEKKEKFFEDRIREEYSIPNSRIMNPDNYDAVLIGPNNERLFVAIKSVHTDSDYLDGFTVADNKFESRNNRIFYKDQELCSKMGKKFYSKPSPKGPVNLLVVDNLSELDELLDSSVYSGVRYKYRSNNIAEVIKHAFSSSIKNGVITKPIFLNNTDGSPLILIKPNQTIEEYLKFRETTGELDNLVKYLNTNEEYQKNRNIEYQAKQKYAAFVKQLQYVGARIPTQSMQSFMGLQLVGFSNSDVNEVYVPAAQTWLEGSDYMVNKRCRVVLIL